MKLSRGALTVNVDCSFSSMMKYISGLNSLRRKWTNESSPTRLTSSASCALDMPDPRASTVRMVKKCFFIWRLF